jgi:hypothetical protein
MTRNSITRVEEDLPMPKPTAIATQCRIAQLSNLILTYYITQHLGVANTAARKCGGLKRTII